MSKRHILAALASAVVLFHTHPVMAQDQVVKQVHFTNDSSDSVIKNNFSRANKVTPISS